MVLGLPGPRVQGPQGLNWPVSNFHVGYDTASMFNRVTVRGGLAPGATSTSDSFTGNGSTKVFQLTRGNVQEIVSVTVAGTTKTFGTAWYDSPASFDCLVNYVAGTITFGTAPGNGQSISVRYTYQSEISVTRDITDVGGSNSYGVWSEHEIEDRSITTAAEAQALADALLLEYGTQITVGSFMTNKLGLEPGQAISITDPVLGLSGTYTIRRVTTELDPAGTGVIATVQFGGRPTKLSWLTSRMPGNQRTGAYGYTQSTAQRQRTGNQLRVVQTAGSYSMTDQDGVIAVTNTAAARTITLLPAATAGAGRWLYVKDTSGGAGSKPITIQPSSGLIDGAASQTLGLGYGSYSLYSDGSQWRVLTDTNILAKDGTITGLLQITSGAGGILISGPSRTIESMNYVAGSSGWCVKPDGSAEFNNVTARGYVNASSGKIAGWTINGNKLVSADEKLVLDATGAAAGIVMAETILIGYSSPQKYIYVYNGGLNIDTYCTIGTDLNHNGTKIGFFGKAATTQQSHVTNAKADYASGDLDTEAEVITAINAANGKLNSVLACLQAYGLMAAS